MENQIYLVLGVTLFLYLAKIQLYAIISPKKETLTYLNEAIKIRGECSPSVFQRVAFLNSQIKEIKSILKNINRIIIAGSFVFAFSFVDLYFQNQYTMFLSVGQLLIWVIRICWIIYKIDNLLSKKTSIT